MSMILTQTTIIKLFQMLHNVNYIYVKKSDLQPLPSAEVYQLPRSRQFGTKLCVTILGFSLFSQPKSIFSVTSTRRYWSQSNLSLGELLVMSRSSRKSDTVYICICLEHLVYTPGFTYLGHSTRWTVKTHQSNLPSITSARVKTPVQILCRQNTYQSKPPPAYNKPPKNTTTTACIIHFCDD